MKKRIVIAVVALILAITTVILCLNYNSPRKSGGGTEAQPLSFTTIAYETDEHAILNVHTWGRFDGKIIVAVRDAETGLLYDLQTEPMAMLEEHRYIVKKCSENTAIDIYMWDSENRPLGIVEELKIEG